MASKAGNPGGADTLEQKVQKTLGKLSPVEQRVARFFIERKETVLLGSAAQIASEAGSSDATVVRTAQALGFSGLASLRQSLLTELTGLPSPGRRLKRSLDQCGEDAAKALHHVISLHEEALLSLKEDETATRFAHAIDLLAGVRRRMVFGIGPSGLMASYAALQFNRIGLPTLPLTETGIGLADQMLWMEPGDGVLMMAYAPLYREVTVVLERAAELSVPVVLVSDSLGILVGDQVAEVVPVPRGRADHLAMHGATMVVLEAMILALAGRCRDEAFERLESFSEIRGAIDRDWLKRGVKKVKR
ncbi:MurR/RpiR family transcriptional regulator [Allorhizobium sp. BGMRC 0089]|uniref:MurR/RpiR family transcriptional regulator n=1 Tax=Allorhizobium sonneratiae TaxID=2934936 RepID=UPI00203339AA|nr:MurR/RpiR family transcriptional regulator [Allorhizobium sonneratiae]MCM2294665.1 MurR/RpiR family transcriptional regulator [Allorhizobium sonneratiae]